MKRKIETRCLILEIQLFLERKFSDLKFCIIIYWFWLWFDAFNKVLSQSLACNYFPSLSKTQSACWILNLFDDIFKQGNGFLLLLVTKLQNKIKIIKSAQNYQYYQKSYVQVKVARDSGLLAEIKILLLLDGRNFLQN